MREKALPERRTFLKQTLALGMGVAMTPHLLHATMPGKQGDTKGGDGFTFLFQGDSITDGNRTRNNDWNHVMGHGYQYIVSSKLWYDLPAKRLHFLNKGVSGNKITDLANRWQKDTLDLKPDVLSILIGINDTSAFINGNEDFAAEQYETGYRALLQATMKQLPQVQLVLCEPFILPVGKIKDRWEEYATELKKRQASVLKLSEEFGAIFIPLQKTFNKALSKAPADYWIWDGIHPMPAGHELIAREWIYHVRKTLKFIK